MNAEKYSTLISYRVCSVYSSMILFLFSIAIQTSAIGMTTQRARGQRQAILWTLASRSIRSPNFSPSQNNLPLHHRHHHHHQHSFPFFTQRPHRTPRTPNPRTSISLWRRWPRRRNPTRSSRSSSARPPTRSASTAAPRTLPGAACRLAFICAWTAVRIIGIWGCIFLLSGVRIWIVSSSLRTREKGGG